MPYHLLLDTAGEAKLGKLADRHHRRGIGPCYADKAARLGIRVQDLLDEKILKKKIVAALEPKRLTLRPFAQGPRARPADDDRGVPHLRPPPRAAHRRHRRARAGTLLDAGEHGDLRGRPGRRCSTSTTAPIRSSPPRTRSPARPASAPASGPTRHRRGLGHRQGLRDARRRRARSRPSSTTRSATSIRERGGEFGTTTGRAAAQRLARPRRAALRRAPQHADRARRSPSSTCSPASTRIRVCTRYRGAEEATFDDFPYHQSVLHHATGEYERAARAGARTSASAARVATCPQAARDYLDFIAELRRRADRRWSASAPAASRSSGPTARRPSRRRRGLSALAGARARRARRGAAGAGRGRRAESIETTASVICTLTMPSSVQ